MNNKISVGLLSFIAVVIGTILPVTARTITLTPGTFPQMLASLENEKPRELILNGSTNVTDLVALKYIPVSVVKIDMMDLKIEAFSFTDNGYHGRRDFAAGELPPYMLFATGVTEITLPASTSLIGEAAFASTPLEKISIPGSAVEIGKFAFYNCESLADVSFSSPGLLKIGEGAFENCHKLRGFSFPASLLTIGDRAFSKTSISRAEIPGVTEIGEFAFSDIPELSTMLVNSKANVRKGAFFNNQALDKITSLPGNTPALLAALSKLSAPEGTVNGPEVGEGAFAGVEADSLSFSKNVTHIAPRAFREMKNLKAIDISSKGADVPEADPAAFEGTDISKVILYVEIGKEDPWRAAPVWKDFQIKSRVSSVEEVTSDASDIVISVNGKKIEVRASSPIQSVEIFSLDGISLLSETPGKENWSAEMPDGSPVVIVRASDGKNVRILKTKN